MLQTSGGDRTFVPGVNLGPTIPGRSPGEVAVGAEEYRRWFPAMSALGFRLVRIYTILPPSSMTNWPLTTERIRWRRSTSYTVCGCRRRGSMRPGDIFSDEVVGQFSIGDHRRGRRRPRRRRHPGTARACVGQLHNRRERVARRLAHRCRVGAPHHPRQRGRPPGSNVAFRQLLRQR